MMVKGGEGWRCKGLKTSGAMNTGWGSVQRVVEGGVQ